MSIITITRGSYSRGKEVAEILAEKLGYVCLSRELLLEASEQFNIPEIRLVRAPLSLRKKLTPKIKDTVKSIKEVKGVDVSIIPIRQS